MIQGLRFRAQVPRPAKRWLEPPCIRRLEKATAGEDTSRAPDTTLRYATTNIVAPETSATARAKRVRMGDAAATCLASVITARRMHANNSPGRSGTRR